MSECPHPCADGAFATGETNTRALKYEFNFGAPAECPQVSMLRGDAVATPLPTAACMHTSCLDKDMPLATLYLTLATLHK